MSFHDSIREQVEARIIELRFELTRAEKLLATLDEEKPVEKPVKRASAKPTGQTEVLRVSNKGEVTEIEAKPVRVPATKGSENGSKSNKKQQIQELLEEGMTPKDIAEATGIKVSYVYLVKREMAQE